MKETSMREAFGQTLLELADIYPKMVVLDADVSNSTKTIHFGEKYPERFYNVGVAEANMVNIAGGMATCGLQPMVSSFAIFLSLKTTDQIRNIICYNNLPVIIAGGYSGLSDSFDGASHQSIIDIAIMRAMPNLSVLVPGDTTEVKQSLQIGLEMKTPVYIRLGRNPSPVLFEDDKMMEYGQNRIIQEGTDLTIAVCGIPTYLAIQASEILASRRISCEILQVSTIKPLDHKSLVQSVKKTGRILAIEEHSTIGGLGGAISETLGKLFPVKMEMIGIEDKFTESGPYEDLLRKYGLSVENIVDRALSMI